MLARMPTVSVSLDSDTRLHSLWLKDRLHVPETVLGAFLTILP